MNRYKEYQKQYKIENKEVLNEYNKNYYKENRERLKAMSKNNAIANKGNCLYRIIDEDGSIIYIGSTNDMYQRYYQHISKLSNLKQYDLTNCVFHYVELSKEPTKEERLMIEQYLINSFEPKYNQQLAYKGNIIDE